jgi:hypothetical protein
MPIKRKPLELPPEVARKYAGIPPRAEPDQANFLARSVSFICLCVVIISLTLGAAIFVRH